MAERAKEVRQKSQAFWHWSRGGGLLALLLGYVVLLILCWIYRGRFCLELTIGLLAGVVGAMAWLGTRVYAVVKRVVDAIISAENKVGRVDVKNDVQRYLRRLRVRRKVSPDLDDWAAEPPIEIVPAIPPNSDPFEVEDVSYQGPVYGLHLTAELSTGPDDPVICDRTCAQNETMEALEGIRELHILVRPNVSAHGVPEVLFQGLYPVAGQDDVAFESQPHAC